MLFLTYQPLVQILDVLINSSKKTENTTNTETDNKVDNTANTEIDNKVDNTTNPKTGDNIIIFSIIFVIALTGIVATCIISKKKVKNNK